MNDYRTNKLDKMVKSIDIPCFAIKPETLYKVFNLTPLHNQKNWSLRIEEYQKNKPNILEEINNRDVDSLKIKIFKPSIIDNTTPSILRDSSGIGPTKYNNIINSINFYDEHAKVLLEQYSYAENPFYYMQEEKLSRVRDNRVEIFEILDEQGIEFIFGTLGNCPELAKKLEVEKRSHLKQAQFKKLKTIEEIIANYITVDEAVDITNPKVLSKFVLPYGKR